MNNEVRNAFMEIFESDGKVSHKRIVTIAATLLLAVTCFVVWLKGSVDQQLMLVYALIAFVSSLVGITAVADNRSKRIEKENGTTQTEDIP